MTPETNDQRTSCNFQLGQLTGTNRYRHTVLARHVNKRKAIRQVSQCLVKPYKYAHQRYRHRLTTQLVKAYYQQIKAELAIVREEIDDLGPLTLQEVYRELALRQMLKSVDGKLLKLAQEITRL